MTSCGMEEKVFFLSEKSFLCTTHFNTTHKSFLIANNFFIFFICVFHFILLYVFLRFFFEVERTLTLSVNLFCMSEEFHTNLINFNSEKTLLKSTFTNIIIQLNDKSPYICLNGKDFSFFFSQKSSPHSKRLLSRM